MKILSLFDVYSGGQQALKELGIYVEEYYASEIDKYAIGVTQYNHPKTIQIGDVTKVRYEKGILYTEKGELNVGKIDAVIGGSPCQGFSFAGKQLNFDDPRSALFFEWLRICHEACPTYFFLENVKMKKEFEQVISEYLGVEPIFLDSNLVSAQNRKRLYWTNIEGYVEPEDYGILLKDIVHENVDIDLSATSADNKAHCLTDNYSKHSGISDITKSYTKSNGTVLFEGIDKYIISPDILEKTDLNPSTTNNVTTINPRRTDGKQTYQQDRVYDTNGKIPAITAELGGRFNIIQSNCLIVDSHGFNIVEDLKKYIVPFDKTLQIIEKEVERGKVGFFRKDSQANRVYYIHDKAITLCGDAGGGAAKMGQYLFGCITPDRVEKRQNGQRFNDGRKFYTLTAQDKHGILIEGYIRKLTPTECERLQTLPDSYTKYGIINGKTVEISDSQRYKMLGNGWTIEAIKQFFKNIEQEEVF